MPDYAKILHTITHHPDYLRNLPWGKPRRGHPEGTIANHIAQLEDNLTHLSPRLSDEEQQKLRLLIHVHDTFKPDSTDGVRITDPRSHASLARSFLAQFLFDPDLLNILQYHDEPYALYLQFEKKGIINRERLDALLHAIHDLNLFTAFLIIDNCIPGKSRKPLIWWFNQIPPNRTRFQPTDIVP